MERMNSSEWSGFFDEHVLRICSGFAILKLTCRTVGIELSSELRDDI